MAPVVALLRLFDDERHSFGGPVHILRNSGSRFLQTAISAIETPRRISGHGEFGSASGWAKPPPGRHLGRTRREGAGLGTASVAPPRDFGSDQWI